MTNLSKQSLKNPLPAKVDFVKFVKFDGLGETFYMHYNDIFCN